MLNDEFVACFPRFFWIRQVQKLDLSCERDIRPPP